MTKILFVLFGLLNIWRADMWFRVMSIQDSMDVVYQSSGLRLYFDEEPIIFQ
jgi:hypothetical protein